ncbi:hypothetical protein IH601_09650 [Candidatus Bipolaricaulota bacterium]|nr:hypothetical protein [Candidatus Bipolaricaulota bacterium]TFH07233.1 MAG: hypothetical protein E4H08_09840 [Candidatus Atribacteria bacterium]
MNKMRSWIAGLMIVSLLAVGVAAVAGNGFGSSVSVGAQQAAAGTCSLYERDADGDGILNSEDADWVRPLDGSGYGQSQGYGQNLSGQRPLDGSGFGGHGGGAGQRLGGLGDGSCL